MPCCLKGKAVCSPTFTSLSFSLFFSEKYPDGSLDTFPYLHLSDTQQITSSPFYLVSSGICPLVSSLTTTLLIQALISFLEGLLQLPVSPCFQSSFTHSFSHAMLRVIFLYFSLFKTLQWFPFDSRNKSKLSLTSLASPTRHFMISLPSFRVEHHLCGVNLTGTIHVSLSCALWEPSPQPLPHFFWVILSIEILQASSLKRQIVLKGYNMKTFPLTCTPPTPQSCSREAVTFQVFQVFLVFISVVGSGFQQKLGQMLNTAKII